VISFATVTVQLAAIMLHMVVTAHHPQYVLLKTAQMLVLVPILHVSQVQPGGEFDSYKI
jgi:hypothetical protein